VRPVYFYELLLPTGGTRLGLEAIPLEMPSSARAWLERTHEHSIVVRLHKLPLWLATIGHRALRMVRGDVKPEEVAALLRDLAVMTGAGIPIREAIRSCIDDGEVDSSAHVIRVCKQLSEDLDAGNSLSTAVQRQADVFPSTVCGLVLIGEESGNLSDMLLEASSHMARVLTLRANAKQALIYPALSLLAVLGAGAFWIVYVLPNLVQLFKQLNAKLPPFTVRVLEIAQWLSDHATALFFVTAVAVVSALLVWRLSERVRKGAFTVMHRLPIVRGILVASGIAFFSEYLGILVRSGIDIVGSLKILEQAQVDAYYVDRIVRMRAEVERGTRLSASMRHVGGFPSLLVRMISVGEESGSLDKQLGHVAEEYAVRLQRLVGTLGEVIKPLMIVIVGGVLLVLIVALLLPVYDLIGQTMAIPR
jgi:type II secretory pathway component PulF